MIDHPPLTEAECDKYPTDQFQVDKYFVHVLILLSLAALRPEFNLRWDLSLRCTHSSMGLAGGGQVSNISQGKENNGVCIGPVPLISFVSAGRK